MWASCWKNLKELYVAFCLKEDLGSSILSLCSYSPSKVPVRLPHLLSGDVKFISLLWFGKDPVPDTCKDSQMTTFTL